MKEKQTSDSAQGGEGTRPGAFNNPGLYPPTFSIGKSVDTTTAEVPPKDKGTK